MPESFNDMIASFEREAALKVRVLKERRAELRGEPVPTVAAAPPGLAERAGPDARSMRPTAASRTALQTGLDGVRSGALAELDDQLEYWSTLHEWAKQGYLYMNTSDTRFLPFQIERAGLVGAAAKAGRTYYAKPAEEPDLPGDRYLDE